MDDLVYVLCGWICLFGGQQRRAKGVEAILECVAGL
jgi:hypothetical protein